MAHANDIVEPLAPLSERERVVALKWAEGLTYREIAETLFIAPTTVRGHLATIYKKLGIRHKAALVALLSQNAGVVEALLSSTALPPPACPYPGMVPYQADDAVYFYGREAEIQQMVQHLRQQRFLMVIGPSGSGKSSLIYAGLLPKLVQSRYFEPDHWLIRTLRPGSQPTRHLAGLLDCPEDGPFATDTIQALLAAHPPAQQLLLLVDQFEEVFTQANREQRAQFIAALQALRTPANCALILTLRADFYPDLMNSYLWPVDASQRLDVAPLRGQALRDAIEKPAAAVGVSLEDRLVTQLLADAADEPGVLPLLQETMGLLWDDMEQRLLSYETYDNLSARASQLNSSGLAVAMAMKADSTLANLSSEQQAIARRIFLRLIQFGEGRADTRRQQPVAALRAATDAGDEFEYTLEHLTDHRLLTRSGGDDESAPAVDISHESLINGWSRLQDWAEERREAEQIRRRLEGKAAEWVRLGKGSGGLLSDVELPEAEYWLASDDAADLGFDATLPELVKVSQKAIFDAEQARETIRQQELRQAEALAEEQRQRIEEQTRASKRMQRSMMGLAAVLLIAIAAGLFAWKQSEKAQTLAMQETAARKETEIRRVEAEQARTEAETRRMEAETARLASLAQLLLIQAPQQQAVLADERGALLARQAYLFSSMGSRLLQEQVDEVLRTVIGKPYFSSILLRTGTGEVTFSPDGTQLVAQKGNYEVLLWDLRQSRIAPIVLTGYPKKVAAAFAYHPDGKTLLVASRHGTVGQWDLNSPTTPMVELLRHSAGIWSATYSADGRWLALGSKSDDTFLLWDLGQPDSVPLLVNDPQPAPNVSIPAIEAEGDVPVAFSSDSMMLATGSLDGIIRLWQPDDTTTPITSLRGHEGGLLALTFYKQGKYNYLASSGQDKTIRLWNLDQLLIPPVVLNNGDAAARSLAIDAHTQTLASTSNGDGIQFWQIKSLDIEPLVIQPGYIHQIAFSPDGKYLASGGSDSNYLRLWDMQASGQPQVLTGHQSGVYSLAFSPDQTLLASGSAVGEGVIRLWRWDALDQLPVVFDAHEGSVNSLDFSNDGTQLLSASWNHNAVRLWDLSQPTPTFTTLPMSGSNSPWTARFSPDEKTVATSGNGILIWDLANLSASAKVLLTAEDWTTGLAFNPSNNMLAMSGRGDPLIYLQDYTQPEQPPSTLHGHDLGAVSLDFSPDGKLLASGGRDDTVRLWDPDAPEKPSIVLGRHNGAVWQVRFSPDGKQLASAGEDYDIRLWNVGQPDALPIVLSGHETQVGALAYSPDSKYLISGSDDKIILMWDLAHPLNSSTTQAIADKVCEKVLRNLTLGEWHDFIGVDIPYDRTCANLPIHPSLFEAAEKQAKAGDKEGAVALLERALELNPNLELKPHKKVEQWSKMSEQ